jgi:hypothetical protein
MRYSIKEETYKHGRRTETQFAIWDSITHSSVARFGKREQAQEIIDKYEAAQARAEQ